MRRVVDAAHRDHLGDQQRQPLSGQWVGPHRNGERVGTDYPGDFADALGRQVVSLVRHQVHGAVAGPLHDAFGEQVAQGLVDRGLRLAEDARQFRRVDERCTAEGVA